jgi:bacterioferritin
MSAIQQFAIICNNQAAGAISRLACSHTRMNEPCEKGVAMNDIDKPRIVSVLNRILEQELAGVVRYTHYSFLVFGFGRIPIVSWLRTQADEALLHAQQAGEMITQLGEYPSLSIGPLLDSHRTDIATILTESLEAENVALGLYRELLNVVEGRSVMLEEYARQLIYAEELHAGEVDKMLRKPGHFAAGPALPSPADSRAVTAET